MRTLIRSFLSRVMICLGVLALPPMADAGDGPSPPTVTTPTKANITATTATLGGDVTDSGNVALATHGIVYALTSENPHPKVGGVGVTFVSENTSSTGVFTLPVTGLTPGSNYSYAAYALNIDSDEAYSALDTFSTTPIVSHILPPNGTTAGGTAVTIVGYGFTGATSVSIGGVAATGVTVLSDTMIDCTTGAHAVGTVDVVVGAGTGSGLYTYGAKPTPAGESWTDQTGSGLHNWTSIASSADGSKLAATIDGTNSIYTSTDSGVTWTEQTASGQYSWTSIASSADGNKLVASVYKGYIYTSTNAGVTWTEQTGSGKNPWSSVASSADGQKLAAVASYGAVYTSIDGGVTWTERTSAGVGYWGSVASSADGKKLVASINYKGYIYTSTDGGANWTEQTGAGLHSWAAIASSADGSKLAAVDYDFGDHPGYIYTSTDSGATWTEQTGSGKRGWNAIASSADGGLLAAEDYNGYIYTSTDGGLNWTEQTTTGVRSWKGIASSADGSKLAATSFGSYICTSVGVTKLPKLKISDNGGKTYVDSGKRESLGSVRVNTRGKGMDFLLTNSGDSDLNVGALTIDGRSASDFSVSSLFDKTPVSVGGAHVMTSTVVSTTMKPGDILFFTVTFSPSVVGPRSATLHIPSDDPDVSDFTLDLSGTGTAPSILVADDDDGGYLRNNAKLDLGSVVTGKSGSPRHMRIANIKGTASLTVGKMFIDSKEFALTPLVLDQRAGNASSDAVVQQNTGFVINAGQSATFTITFTPSEVGKRSAVLRIPSDDPNIPEYVINLTGLGQQTDPPTVTLPKTPPVLNIRTGLYEWLLTVRNPNVNAITGFDLYISDLPSGVSVSNAATDLLPASLPGTSYARLPSKTPVYRLHNGSPLAAGASTTVVVQFFKKTRPMPKLNPTIELVIVASDVPSKGLYGVPVLKVKKINGKGNQVEFASTVGGNYRMWYTANVRNTNGSIPVPSGPWYSVPALIKATGTKTLWMDQGPPATISSPLDDPKREYRVELVLPYKPVGN